MSIPIVEIFNSIEGEGRRSGKLCTFIRTAGCNLRCSYCDSQYTFDVSEAKKMTIEQIIEEVEQFSCSLVTLTGGEPLLQPEIGRLISKLISKGYFVNVETNGSVDISMFNRPPQLFFTMDWKSPSSGMNDKMLATNLQLLKRGDVLKFVVGDLNDLIDMNMILKDNNIQAMVYISPVFGKIEMIDIVEFMKNNHLNNATLQIQLHKVIWAPDERGV